MAMVPVTATPYAPPKAADDRKPRTRSRHPTIRAVFTAGT